MFIGPAMLLAGLLVASCDQLTGPMPEAKPCATDTTYWMYRVSPVGRIIDSVQVTVALDACARTRK